MEFFSEKELAMQIGHDPDAWPLALLKELIDNGLDAAENGAGEPPLLMIEVSDDAVSVHDNGPGLPAATIDRSLDYTVRVSDKNHYVSPSRGQLGNALKCVYAAPYVAGGDLGRVDITTGGQRHEVTVRLDRITQKPALSHEVETDDCVRNGTLVRIAWPEIASSLNGDVPGLLRDYGAFNPHASFTATACDYAAGSSTNTTIIGIDAGWTKWKSTDPTSPHWYTTERLRDLVAAYLTQERAGVRARTLREFIAEFRGLAGTAKQKAVTASLGLTGAYLHDLVAGDDVNLEMVASLLTAMQRESRPVKAAALGVLGREHLTRHLVEHREVCADSVRYKRVDGEDSGLPFVMEVAFGVCTDEAAERGREVAVGLNWSAAIGGPIRELLGLLGEQRVDYRDPVAVLVHLACPVMQFTDRGKGVLQLTSGQLDALRTALRLVTKDWKKAKRSADKDDRVRRRDLEKQRKSQARPPSIKDAAYYYMEAAYLKASDGGRLPANARMLMYALRPYVLAETSGECWKESSYFTQTLLPDYMAEHAAATAGWNVVYDARGHLREPHGGARVDLGTLGVRSYLRSRPVDADEIAPSALITTQFPTIGPENRYRFVLFIEKEGFDPLLEAARIAERFDIGIMSTKGMSVVAARTAVEALSTRGVTFLVMHDFDKSGFSILHTLRTSTRRYQFETRPNVVDLGLRLADIEAMGLQGEPVEYSGERDPRINLLKSGATAEECAYLVSHTWTQGGRNSSWEGQRVELNAMTADQFVVWLEGKLAVHGVEKVVPPTDVLESAYRRAVRIEAVRSAVEATLAATDGNEIAVPAGLLDDVTRRIAGTADAWDDAVLDIVREAAR